MDKTRAAFTRPVSLHKVLSHARFSLRPRLVHA